MTLRFRSRYLLLLLALTLVLIGICLRRVATKTEGSKRCATAKVEGSRVPAEEANAISMVRGEPGRAREANASAKLRSLLKVRQGELGIVRVPVEKAAAGLGGLGIGFLGPVPEENTPVVLNVRDVERFSEELETRVSQDDSIDGAVQAVDGPFEWRSSDFEIKGQGLSNSDEEKTLMLNIRFGEREMVTTFTAKVGTMFMIHPGGGAEDAALMVVGGETAGADEDR